MYDVYSSIIYSIHSSLGWDIVRPCYYRRPKSVVWRDKIPRISRSVRPELKNALVPEAERQPPIKENISHGYMYGAMDLIGTKSLIIHLSNQIHPV